LSEASFNSSVGQSPTHPSPQRFDRRGVISQDLYRRFYPDDSLSGTTAFYNWVRSAVRPDMALLNLGAGPPSNNRVRAFKGDVKLAAGVDIDPVVLTNPELDEARLIVDGKIPYEAGSFDLVLSDFVLEHVEHPALFLTEVRRVLRRGGSFFFRTPNLWHYTGIIARMTPHVVHEKIANKARGLSEDAHEPYPTYFRMNTRGSLNRAARAAGFEKIELKMIEAEPSYMVFNPIVFRLGVAYERMVNRFEALSFMRVNILGHFQA